MPARFCRGGLAVLLGLSLFACGSPPRDPFPAPARPGPAASEPVAPGPSAPGPSGDRPPGERVPLPAPPAVSSPPAVPAQGPARLMAGAGEACLTSIEDFASRLTGNRVLLGPAAFASRSELSLVRQPRRGSDGRLLDGRIVETDSVVLRLHVDGEGCFVQSGMVSERLPACRCERVGQ